MTINAKPALLDSSGVKYQTAEFFEAFAGQPLIIGPTETAAPYAPGSRLLVMQDPVHGFQFQPGNHRIQSYGTGTTRPTQSPTGVTGTSVNGSTVRVARVADPDDAGKWAFWMRADVADPLTFNGRRSEFSYDDPDARFFVGQRVVIGAMLRFPDWTGVPTGDKLLVLQLHGKTDIQPWLSINWDGSRCYLRHTYDNAALPTNETGDANVSETDITWAPNTWMRIALEVKIAPGGGGAVRAMVNGSVIRDYTGPIGFNEYNYFKTGVYKWSSSNTWTTTGTLGTREVYLKGPYMFRSETETAEQMDALLVARA